MTKNQNSKQNGQKSEKPERAKSGVKDKFTIVGIGTSPTASRRRKR